ncbi:EAL domain-containing protein [Ectobacillus antri]|uniref:EAL domain-containing protein n=1 Tax=Ectobacillus antri TaxID=2486280 RepID=A0ABT6HAK9_9BACI|nr:EAL domain-containing protein [Ectobacillus antri]MDG4658557.1 EAL domain-containing protein [Ectobacillus antri]MDG5755561.1 EAL domain-containing protein [Ectobacillus antri]
MGQAELFVYVLILLSMFFFYLVFENSKRFALEGNMENKLWIPVFAGVYLWTLLYTFLYINKLVTTRQYLSWPSMLPMFLFIVMYIIAYKSFFKVAPFNRLRYYLGVSVYMSFAKSAIVWWSLHKLIPGVTLHVSHILLGGILVGAGIFFTVCLIQLFYAGALEVPSPWLLLLTCFTVCYVFAISCLEFVQGVTTVESTSLYVGEAMSLFVLLAITVLYLEKYHKKEREKLSKVNEYLDYLAYHDTLTRLPNRRKIMEVMASYIQKNTPFGVYFIDLDNFKDVNDLWGHDIGDELLQRVACELKKHLRPTDIIGRLGGDEFIILRTDTLEDSFIYLGNRLVDGVTEPITIRNYQLQVTVSAGLARFPQDASDLRQLMKKADIAMYESKARGRNIFCCYSADLDEHVTRTMRLKEDLKKAAMKGQLSVHYQPKFQIDKRKLEGFEALMRWNHPELGVIAPAEFIPLAEETGLIHELGAWILQEACTQIAALNRQLEERFYIAVNFSVKQTREERIIRVVQQALATSGLPAELLEIEVTESIVMEDAQRVNGIFAKLRALGVSISMDDFGTGYNSFSHLKQFRFQRLKIDRGFVQHLGEDSHDTAIVAAIISMAHQLGIKITAEGVETQDQLHILQEMGCDDAQGYYFSKPLPLETIQQLLLQKQLV